MTAPIAGRKPGGARAEAGGLFASSKGTIDTKTRTYLTRRIKSLAELRFRTYAYFHSIPMDEWMITGLAVYLGVSVATLWAWEKRHKEGEEKGSPYEGFGEVIKRAKTMIEHAYEKHGMRSKNPSFDIFRLKNLGWIDSKQTDIVSGGRPIPIMGGAAKVEKMVPAQQVVPTERPKIKPILPPNLPTLQEIIDSPDTQEERLEIVEKFVKHLDDPKSKTEEAETPLEEIRKKEIDYQGVSLAEL